ncbi:DUF6668 family protein [Kocuria carniphila]|uniref:DUF6668 family protein n=1 Tax=Kocuria carniphila TaxID=262208 RepID=UPI0034DB0AF9
MEKNRWSTLLPSLDDVQEKDSRQDAVDPEAVEVLSGATKPQVGLTFPEREGLGEVLTDGVGVHWVGAHGGSGETTLQELLGGRACSHRWPRVSKESPHETVPVLLVARRNQRGMAAASKVAREWASGSHSDVELLGLVLIDDAPGKIPRSLQHQAKVLAGAVPRTWILPWIEDLRVHGEVDSGTLGRSTEKILASISEVVEEHNPRLKGQRND